jgi:hypothetical protein
MALIQTDFTPALKYIPYTGLSALERSQSGIARAELQYYAVNQSWASPGAGNSRLLKTQITLPNGFGYVITDCMADVTALNTKVSSEATAQLQIQPSGVLGPNVIVNMASTPGRQLATATTPIGDIPARDYNSTYPSWRGDYGSITTFLADKPTFLLYDYEDGRNDSLVSFTIGEENLNGSAYSVQFFIRFLQFDVDQSYNYVLNSPQLTR